ncbi:hypothetical protein Hypma_001927 [Hypsizygus marmoreus]|uniref:Reverse transcriptase domain-containing protein n=1 Tax=Hypsizygus marmoreus TaxID=39966 RepID=A0A369J4X2_HYPMA|nr:hypothetical protein Hypma_001927 [Hypsizygus marmoreus]
MSSNGQRTPSPDHTGQSSPDHTGQSRSVSPLEDELSRSQGGTAPDPPRDFTTFNTDVIDRIEAIIEQYRISEISKASALIEILSHLRSTDTTPATQSIAFENYIGTIDTISSQSTEGLRRGQHAAAGLRHDEDTAPDPSRHGSSHLTDDAVASFLGSIVSDHSTGSSKRSRDFSSESDDSTSEEESSGTDRDERKKRSIKESKLPWHRRELKARKKGPLSCTKTRKLLKYFGRNTGKVKQFIKLAQSAPLGFPSSEWDNIIKGNPINLDIVLSTLHHIGAPAENIGRLGSTQIKLGAPEPTRKVQTSGDWTSAWNTTIKATIFVFRHRESELRDYADYIEGLFASKVTSSHSHVIAYDKAIRAETESNPLAEPKRHPPRSRSINLKSATVSTPPKVVPTLTPSAFTATSAGNADSQDTQRKIAKSTKDVIHGLQPKYLRYNLWREDGSFTPSCADWTINATPLPPPPQSELDDPVVSKTIHENPHLFAIVTPIKVDVFESLLAAHPNQPFVKSVCRGLREGFWPWANTHLPNYPITHDASLPPPSNPVNAAFIRSQRDIEITKHRFSPSFGTKLLPGMYSMPVHAVPKPGSTDLRMVTDQSAGEFSLNSMVLHEDIAGYPLDNMRHLGEILIALHNTNHPPLTLFKSDIAEAYRLMPVHPHWQIKQINTIDGFRHVDRNGAFGGRGTGSFWISFNALVTWIAIHVKLIHFLCAYSDDSFGPNTARDVTFYPPYKKYSPQRKETSFRFTLEDHWHRRRC